jgi:hypothetical protein
MALCVSTICYMANRVTIKLSATRTMPIFFAWFLLLALLKLFAIVEPVKKAYLGLDFFNLSA